MWSAPGPSPPLRAPRPIELLTKLAEDAPAGLDLTNPDHLEAVRRGAEALRSEGPPRVLAEIDRSLAGDDAAPLSVRVAAKLALSRALLEAAERPVHVSVVFAVYKEHLRILPSTENPIGEDFLREKLRQLRWLFDGSAHTWDLTIVDDGCPEGSGRIAQEVLADFARADEETRVLFLEEAVRDGLPIVANMKSARDSQKGGAIRLGLWSAAREVREAYHVALFTDADLSTHLGQIGLLASPLEAGECLAAIGSRREATSVVVKTAARNERGKLLIYLWKRLIPQLRGVVDTQCGFKAFDVEAMRSWITDLEDNTFSFDVEALLRVALHQPGSILRVPIAWIDSEAASTTTDLEPYLPMLKSFTRLHREELPASVRAEPYARLIERLDADTFNRLLANIPSAIADRQPIEFDDFDDVSAAELAAAAGLE